MDIYRQHEVFQIEVLDRMKTARVIDSLVFGGGSMLRLCHELNRYSVDLDFWFLKQSSQRELFDRIRHALSKEYEITDSHRKRRTMLLELRSPSYPRRLKIEIRRETKDWDYQEKIAFSRFSTRQVVVKAHTLEQTMKNKIEAFLDRGEIRDGFDIEFLLRRGIELPTLSARRLAEFQKRLARFKERDFKVKLGSILEGDIRKYYAAHGFSYLAEMISARGQQE